MEDEGEEKSDAKVDRVHDRQECISPVHHPNILNLHSQHLYTASITTPLFNPDPSLRSPVLGDLSHKGCAHSWERLSESKSGHD
jgi:hypothetical protein